MKINVFPDLWKMKRGIGFGKIGMNIAKLQIGESKDAEEDPKVWSSAMYPVDSQI